MLIQFVAKCTFNAVVILFWFYDVVASVHEAHEYSVLVRFWLYFSIMTIAAEPFILNLFLPWVKEHDDKAVDERQDKFVRAQATDEQEMPEIVNIAQSTENVSLQNNDLASSLRTSLAQDVNNYQKLLEVKNSVDHKSHQHFEEDFHAMTMLCFLKVNQKKLLLPSNVLSKNLFNSLMLFFL